MVHQTHRSTMTVLIMIAFVLSPSLIQSVSTRAAPVSAPLPVSGVAVPQLAVFDQAMQDYMAQRSIRGATLAVMKNGVVVLERGYGWQDRGQTRPLPPHALLRLASVTKPITAATIRNLARAGNLALSDKVFCRPSTVGTCWLRIEPFGTPDARLGDITIQHLLDHKGGWDRTVPKPDYPNGADPMFQPIYIAGKLGIPSPPSKQDTVRYMMGQPLDFTPGTHTAYSNFGYLLLGLIVEQVTGRSYTAYVQDTVFNPLGVADTEIELGRSLPQFRNLREPWYDHANWTGQCVFLPHLHVRHPDGGFYLEAMEAHGGLIASGRALLSFMQVYRLDGHLRAGSFEYTFFGAIAGTFTMVRQRPDGVNIAVLFNQNWDPSGLRYDVIRTVLDQAADAVLEWPGTAVPAPTVLPTTSPIATPIVESSCIATPTATHTRTPTPTHTPTATNTAVPPTRTATPTSTPTRTSPPTTTATPTMTPTRTTVPTMIPTTTPTHTPTTTRTSTPTSTATRTPTITNTAVLPTRTAMPTNIPTLSPTTTATKMPTMTPTRTATSPTPTRTVTPTHTPMPKVIATTTATMTPTTTNTPTSTTTDWHVFIPYVRHYHD